jgi:hypothetical protein
MDREHFSLLRRQKVVRKSAGVAARVGWRFVRNEMAFCNIPGHGSQAAL